MEELRWWCTKLWHNLWKTIGLAVFIYDLCVELSAVELCADKEEYGRKSVLADSAMRCLLIIHWCWYEGQILNWKQNEIRLWRCHWRPMQSRWPRLNCERCVQIKPEWGLVVIWKADLTCRFPNKSSTCLLIFSYHPFQSSKYLAQITIISCEIDLISL